MKFTIFYLLQMIMPRSYFIKNVLQIKITFQHKILTKSFRKNIWKDVIITSNLELSYLKLNCSLINLSGTIGFGKKYLKITIREFQNMLHILQEMCLITL